MPTFILEGKQTLSYNYYQAERGQLYKQAP